MPDQLPSSLTEGVSASVVVWVLVVGGDDELQAADAQVGSAQHHLHAPEPRGSERRGQGEGARHGQLVLTLAARSTISMHLPQCLKGQGQVGL